MSSSTPEPALTNAGHEIENIVVALDSSTGSANVLASMKGAVDKPQS